jgi:hypothetical protein
VTTTVLGRDLQVGDHIVYIGKPYEIERLDPHPSGGHHVNGEFVRARFAVWSFEYEGERRESGMTILDTDEVEILTRLPFADYLDFASYMDEVISLGPVS